MGEIKIKQSNEQKSVQPSVPSCADSRYIVYSLLYIVYYQSI